MAPEEYVRIEKDGIKHQNKDQNKQSSISLLNQVLHMMHTRYLATRNSEMENYRLNLASQENYDLNWNEADCVPITA